ncbi:MAG: glycosyltransferase, partial [Planctomycetota bacterium]|nr:glycosyltransferase [Planctomycetota bacterium]
MKLLWTISNWKRTGPLEPSLDLAAACVAAGHDVHVAVGRAPDDRPDRADRCVIERGLKLAITGATLSKHSAPLRNWRDARRLAHWIEAERPGAIVATQRNDHVLALRAARGTPVVRLWFGAAADALDPRDETALRHSAGVLAFSA